MFFKYGFFFFFWLLVVHVCGGCLCIIRMHGAVKLILNLNLVTYDIQIQRDWSKDYDVYIDLGIIMQEKLVYVVEIWRWN